MVTATLGARLPATPGTPTKRSVHPSASFPVAKKQRSYEDDCRSTGIMKRGFPEEDREGHYAPSVSSPAQMVKLDEREDRSSSPVGPLKSSLKSSMINNITGTAIDSPTEGDRRGMYSDYVQSALDERARGKDSSYQELVSQFRSPSVKNFSSSPPVGLLQMLLHSLSNVASRLDRRNHTLLVDGILTLPWATMGGDAFARTWTRFVCTLCSARSEWVGEVLSRAVKGLSYRSDWRSLAFAPTGTSSSRPTRRLIYSRIHSLLRSLLSLIPTLPTQLAPLVLRHFPHKRDGIKEHVVYIRNMFEVCEYADELRQGVMECVVGRGVEIDVEIQIELDDLEEAEEDLDGLTAGSDVDGRELPSGKEGDGLDPFDKPIDEDSDSGEDEDDESGSEDGLEDIRSDDEADNADDKGKSDLERTKQIRSLVDKLDAIMQAMFHQLESTDMRFLRVCKGLDGGIDSVLTPARAISLRNDQFTSLMHIFTKTLLPTFKCRHVQFVLFWFSSLDQDFSDLFLGLLLSKAIYGTPSRGSDGEGGGKVEEVPMIMRVAAASYVASLVSRAKYIDKSDARTVMRNLCAFLEAHLDAYAAGLLGNQAYMQRMEDSTVVGPNSLFYAVCQACFYIFCFRWSDLQVGSGEEEEEEGDVSEAEDGGHTSTSTAKWCEGLDVIKRAIMSNLNPLANCSPAVAKQFAGVAQFTSFLYCWSLIERNNRSAAPVKTNSSGNPSLVAPIKTAEGSSEAVHTPTDGSDQHWHSNPASASTIIGELDSFFPFDPYRLPGSTKWVEPLYREWSDVAPDGMINDDDDDEEEEEAESSDGSSTDSAPNQTGLKIPKARRSARPDRFVSSSASTTDEQVAQSLNSLEAMSISPYRGR